MGHLGPWIKIRHANTCKRVLLTRERMRHACQKKRVHTMSTIYSCHSTAMLWAIIGYLVLHLMKHIWNLAESTIIREGCIVPMAIAKWFAFYTLIERSRAKWYTHPEAQRRVFPEIRSPSGYRTNWCACRAARLGWEIKSVTDCYRDFRGIR